MIFCVYKDDKLNKLNKSNKYIIIQIFYQYNLRMGNHQSNLNFSNSQLEWQPLNGHKNLMANLITKEVAQFKIFNYVDNAMINSF